MGSTINSSDSGSVVGVNIAAIINISTTAWRKYCLRRRDDSSPSCVQKITTIGS